MNTEDKLVNDFTDFINSEVEKLNNKEDIQSIPDPSFEFISHNFHNRIIKENGIIRGKIEVYKLEDKTKLRVIPIGSEYKQFIKFLNLPHISTGDFHPEEI